MGRGRGGVRRDRCAVTSGTFSRSAPFIRVHRDKMSHRCLVVRTFTPPSVWDPGMETASERAARRWRESQAQTEAPKAAQTETPAPAAPVSGEGSHWFVASAFDVSARAIADEQYVYAGAFVAHHHLRDAMRRADRTAAVALICTRPLGSHDDDVDKACEPQHTPRCTLAMHRRTHPRPHRRTHPHTSPSPSLIAPGVVLPRRRAKAARRTAAHLAHAHPRGAGRESCHRPLLRGTGRGCSAGDERALLSRHLRRLRH